MCAAASSSCLAWCGGATRVDRRLSQLFARDAAGVPWGLFFDHVQLYLLPRYVCATNAVSGSVQGVMFRKSTLQQAHDLDLRGWVRNEPDGTVSGEAAGATEHVQRL